MKTIEINKKTQNLLLRELLNTESTKLILQTILNVSNVEGQYELVADLSLELIEEEPTENAIVKA
jgi:hypothetical protein